MMEVDCCGSYSRFLIHKLEMHKHCPLKPWSVLCCHNISHCYSNIRIAKYRTILDRCERRLRNLNIESCWTLYCYIGIIVIDVRLIITYCCILDYLCSLLLLIKSKRRGPNCGVNGEAGEIKVNQVTFKAIYLGDHPMAFLVVNI